MQQPQAGILRADSWNIMVQPSHGAAAPQTFASEPSFTMSFPADLQTVKSGERITSAAYGMGSMPPQQSGTLVGPHASGMGPIKVEAPSNGLTMRQESLEAIASTELTRAKGLGGSQTLFADVLEQLSSKEESLPMQAALYRLPSMQFLESLLDEMDSRSADAGCQPPEPPLYLPIDSFDLPGLELPSSTVSDISHLGLPPLPRRVHSANAAMGANAISYPKNIIPRMSSHPSYASYVPMAPTAGSAAASPQKGVSMPRRPGPAAVVRQTAAALEELYGFEDAEVSLQMSKSGRVRKVTSFTGVKRKVGDMMTQTSAPAALGGETVSQMYPHDSHMTTSHCDVDVDDDDVSRDSRRIAGKKSKRTVCINCGSHQTPQWRCGPLGPRTLCNACGVRYKKGLPLNCWPLREGMVLPPGAVLPPSVQVPPGLNIITQPLDSE